MKSKNEASPTSKQSGECSNREDVFYVCSPSIVDLLVALRLSSPVKGQRPSSKGKGEGERGEPDVWVRVSGWGAKKRIRRCLSLLAGCPALVPSHHDYRMFSCFCLVRFFGFSVSCLLPPSAFAASLVARSDPLSRHSHLLPFSSGVPRSRVAPGSFYVRSEREGSRRLKPVSIDRQRDQIARGIVKANDSTTSHQFHPHRSRNLSWRSLHSMLTSIFDILAGTDWLWLRPGRNQPKHMQGHRSDHVKDW